MSSIFVSCPASSVSYGVGIVESWYVSRVVPGSVWSVLHSGLRVSALSQFLCGWVSNLFCTESRYRRAPSLPLTYGCSRATSGTGGLRHSNPVQSLPSLMGWASWIRAMSLVLCPVPPWRVGLSREVRKQGFVGLPFDAPALSWRSGSCVAPTTDNMSGIRCRGTPSSSASDSSRRTLGSPTHGVQDPVHRTV
jgi:hypothetical protein